MKHEPDCDCFDCAARRECAALRARVADLELIVAAQDSKKVLALHERVAELEAKLHGYQGEPNMAAMHKENARLRMALEAIAGLDRRGVCSSAPFIASEALIPQ